MVYNRTSNLINTKRTALYTMVPTTTYYLHSETGKNYFIFFLLKSLSITVFRLCLGKNSTKKLSVRWVHRLFRNKCRQQGNYLQNSTVIQILMYMLCFRAHRLEMSFISVSSWFYIFGKCCTTHIGDLLHHPLGRL